MTAHKIEFLPYDKSGRFASGTIVRDAALELGILIDSSCAGVGTCGKCKVVLKGEVSPPAPSETDLLLPQELAKGTRLSCQAAITGNCVCVIPPESRPTIDHVLTTGLTSQQTLEPDIAKIPLTLAQPELGDRYFDFEHLLSSLKERGHSIEQYDPRLVRDLPQLLRTSQFSITAVVDRDRLLAIEAGDSSGTLLGAAIDIGTTTIAAKLIDLTSGETLAVASAGNPQAAYGADVISRVKYVAEHPGGLKRLHRMLISQLNVLLQEMASHCEIGLQQIYKIVLAGNTVMQHLALQVDPRNLAVKPYAPAFRGPLRWPSRALGLEINEGGLVYVMPNLACFVGSDITGVLTVLDLEHEDELQLVIDMGTNGEIVLGNRERILCSSSPAGPAWEGGCISWGMRATRGAIERAGIDGEDLSFRTISGADPVGICGSGLIDLISAFTRAGLIHSSGRVLDVNELERTVPYKLKRRIRNSGRNGRQIMIAGTAGGSSIVLTQNDVREVQLAKAAIASGIRLMLQELERKPEEIARVRIAGAFGNHIRGEDVVNLGMIPRIPPERIQFIGNAALSGAEAVLRSQQARIKAERLADRIEYLEIADRPDFQERFVEAIPFASI